MFRFLTILLLVLTTSANAQVRDTIQSRTDSLLRANEAWMTENERLLSADSALQSRVTADSLIRIEKLRTDSIEMAVSEMNAKLASETVFKKRFVPDSKRALWLGLVFPGGGQIYNRKYWKLPIFYGGILGCVYAMNWNQQMYNDYRQAYLDIMDSDPNTKSYEDMLPLGYNIKGREDHFKDIFKHKKDYFRKYRDMSLFIMIGVWALSVIDAYVDAELSTFDITPDLSMSISPGIFTTTDHAHQRNITNTGIRLSVDF